MGHTSTTRGKKVYIVTTDGRVIIDTFIERTRSKWIVLKQHGRIHASEIRSFSDYRAQAFSKASSK